jgi:hypothetical protein
MISPKAIKRDPVFTFEGLFCEMTAFSRVSSLKPPSMLNRCISSIRFSPSSGKYYVNDDRKSSSFDFNFEEGDDANNYETIYVSPSPLIYQRQNAFHETDAKKQVLDNRGKENGTISSSTPQTGPTKTEIKYFDVKWENNTPMCVSTCGDFQKDIDVMGNLAPSFG